MYVCLYFLVNPGGRNKRSGMSALPWSWNRPEWRAVENKFIKLPSKVYSGGELLGTGPYVCVLSQGGILRMKNCHPIYDQYWMG